MDGHRAIQERWNRTAQQAADETKPLGPLPDLQPCGSRRDPWEELVCRPGADADIALVDKVTDRLVLRPRRVRLRAS